mmetsp:Transcript_107022/g.303279  ORF Transcript_107022/g.303279 Transcript_107022/m.303279 type:complete len:500 (-) Transcript_107022:125-1624(-)
MSVLDLSPLNTVLQRLERVADRLEAGAGAAGAAGAAPAAGSPAEEDPAIVQAFDAFVKEKVAPVEAAAAEVGGEVVEATAAATKALRLLRDLLLGSAKAKKPKDTDWNKFLGPFMELGQAANKACDNRSDFFQNRKAVAEMMGVVTLVTTTSPPTHVQNCMESMDFHLMKVMQKKKDPETAWAKALKAMVRDLKDWCAENCKLGLTWNAQGPEAVDYFAENPLGAEKAAAAAPAKAKGKGKGPAMPKGGLAPPSAEILAKLKGEEGAAPKPKGGGGGMSAVFSEIGAFSTGGLKKVTDDMKNWKNPKEHGAIKAEPKPKAAAPSPGAGKGSGRGPKGPPKKALERDYNWMIENYDGDHSLTIDEIDAKQLVCVMNCRNCTLRLSSKVKNICVDSCEKVAVICADVLSSVEMVNSNKVQVQTTGKVNSFAVDKCDGVMIWLSKESLGAEIVTSKSSEMNVTIPQEGGDESDVVELPIPEQFVTTISGPRKLKTEVSSLYS